MLRAGVTDPGLRAWCHVCCEQACYLARGIRLLQRFTGKHSVVMTSLAGKSLEPSLKEYVGAQRFPAGRHFIMTSSPGIVTRSFLWIRDPSCLCCVFRCLLLPRGCFCKNSLGCVLRYGNHSWVVQMHMLSSILDLFLPRTRGRLGRCAEPWRADNFNGTVGFKPVGAVSVLGSRKQE